MNPKEKAEAIKKQLVVINQLLKKQKLNYVLIVKQPLLHVKV